MGKRYNHASGPLSPHYSLLVLATAKILLNRVVGWGLFLNPCMGVPNFSYVI